MTHSSTDPGFGIYFHWPFCLAKCPYCDFNSHVDRHVDQQDWANNLCTELEHMSSLQDHKEVTSIFFGGGTPSLMAGATVAQIIDRAAALFALDPDIEITLEANPTSVEAARFEDFATAGVNRVSIGIQALNDKDLKDLGRLHDVTEALDALEVARARFDRVSFDLIYARSGQTLEAWQAELTRALDLEPDHLSLYQLTIEPGTPFAALNRKGAFDLPDEDLASEMYEVTNHLCTDRGLFSYEVSNYAKPGCESRHNLTYWRYGDYLGVGPGAHGRVTRGEEKQATYCTADPKAWSEAVARVGHGLERRERLSRREQGEERLLMGLRLREGIDLNRLQSDTGLELGTAAIRQYEQMGLLTVTGPRLAATEEGRRVLNRLIAELVHLREN